MLFGREMQRSSLTPLDKTLAWQGCETAQKDGSYDVVICDTAGRLHTAYALMEELEVHARVCVCVCVCLCVS